jgi:trehalose/maltose hydrolase-like predicted phosphorylase
VSAWTWTYHGFVPEQERLREALCTLGNGYFATRGAAPEACADEVHYPGTYLAGGYNCAKSEVGGRVIESEDLFNMPNWLPLRLRIEDGPWLDPAETEVLAYTQSLDLRNGLLGRDLIFRDPNDRETRLVQRRLVHMRLHHLAPAVAKVRPRARPARGRPGRERGRPAPAPSCGDRLAARHGPGRRGAGAGSPQRGLSRAHLLGRALHLSAAQPAAARDHPLSPALPLPPTRGRAGAMYPWQSGSDGREETQQWHLNPRSGRWTPDETELRRHVNAAVAFNVWKYYETMGDAEFLSFYGPEMLLEIARFWASLATRNQELERYEILGVIGPDEFHTRYPDRKEPGIDNDAYTNLMAVWVIARALELPQHLPTERWEELEISEEEPGHWDQVSRNMRLCFHGEGIISQFEGLERLASSTGTSLAAATATSTGSTASGVRGRQREPLPGLQAGRRAHALLPLLARADGAPGLLLFRRCDSAHDRQLSAADESWVHPEPGHHCLGARPLRSAALLDPLHRGPRQRRPGGTTAEGIHLGAMAGTIDLIQRCYTGIEIRDQHLWINPALPGEMARRRAISPGKEPIRVRTDGQTHALEADETLEVRLEHMPLFVDAP